MLHITRGISSAIEQQIEDADAMNKVAPKLRVLCIAGVIEPAESYATLGKDALFNVILGGGAGDVFRAPCLRAKVGQALGFAVDQGVIPGVADFGGNTEVSAHRLDQHAIERRQISVLALEVERLEQRCNFIEMPCATVVLGQSLPVCFRPVGAINFRLADSLVVFALRLDWDGEPLLPLRRLDLVAITPVAPGKLHVVVENKFIHCGDHVEVPLPRNVVGLENSDFFQIRSRFF